MTGGDIHYQSSIFRQIYGAAAVNVLSVCNGLSASWTSPVQPTLAAPNNPIRAEPITKEDFSWAGAAIYMGGFIGIYIWKNVADKFGRKINGYALALTQIVGWLGIISAATPRQLIVSRFIMGLGGAGIITSSQLYINETANERIKGPLCSFLIIAMQIGYLFVFILGAILPYRIFNYACLCVPVVFVALFCRLPESPLYLLMRRRDAEAMAVLVWYHHGHVDAAEQKMRALRQSMDANVRPAALRELFADRRTAGATCVALVLFSGHQLCGYSFISSYTVDIFLLSETPVSPYLSSILVYLIQFTTACVIGCVTKNAPKRAIMRCSYAGAGLSLAALSAFMYWRDDERVSRLTLVPTFSLILFVVCYSSGIGPVSYMMVAEMFPARILNNVISVGLTVSIFLAFGTVKMFPALQTAFGGHGTFLLYAAANALLALFVTAFVSKSPKSVLSDDRKTKADRASALTK